MPLVRQTSRTPSTPKLLLSLRSPRRDLAGSAATRHPKAVHVPLVISECSGTLSFKASSELLNGSYFGSRSARESLPTLSTQSSSLSYRSLSTRSEPALSSGGEMAELEHQSSAGGKAQAGGEAEGGKTAQQKQQWGAWHAQVQQLWGSSSQLLARYTSGGKVASLENNCAMQSAWNPVGAQGESDRPQHVVIYICES
ncbi:unnamed protein product [Closterium sp. Naga37s-1]|nr:unnamed protein product [Closterium sp. Naga37s-1]